MDQVQNPVCMGNKLLNSMPQLLVSLLKPSLSHVTLRQGFVCFESGDPIQDVYFPTSGLISLVVSMSGGDVVEAGVIGRDGAAGLQRVFGRRLSLTGGVVQISGTFYKISAEALKRVLDQDQDARQVVHRYTETLLAEAQQLTACNAIHHAGSRLARWLLQAADRTGAAHLPLTQEFLSEMLGIRRTSVTLLAQELQLRGAIKYSRGKITILDRKALEASACECYQVIQDLYRGLYFRPNIASDDAGPDAAVGA